MPEDVPIRILTPVGGSTYEMMFPDPDRKLRMTLVLIAALGEGPSVHPGRLRDAWFEMQDGRPVARLYTRNGGANRQCPHSEGERGCPGCAMRALLSHPQYLEDEDDSFDSTYASIWFRLPHRASQEVVDIITAIAEPGRVDTAAVWREGIARVERGELNEQEQAFGEQLEKLLGDL